MGDELRGESLVHLNVRFQSETELKKFQDLLYEKSGQGVSFTGLLEAMASEVTIVTAIHNIKSNKGSKTAGVDGAKMDRYLQMPKDELTQLIQSKFMDYKPKPARRVYIPKSNGKQRPLGIPTALDRIIQECVRIILEPICEARFYPHSYGFRPYRAQKHAIRDIVNVINASCKSPDQPVWAVEGDIKGCFDNIDHRLLLQKLWRIGVHDKRILKIISQMLKAGYVESDLYHATKSGTPQGGILSPLLSNVYLNDFDWYVGRTYMEPHRQCKHKCNDTRRLKWAGITPKYNFRFADDWVVLTSTEQEALRMKRELTKYFKHKMKLELSQEKTLITNAQKPAKFLGFDVSVRKSDAIKRDKNNVPARYYNGKIVLKVAIETVRNKLEEYSAIRYKVENGRQVWFAKFRGNLMKKKIEDIVAAYNSEIRGFYNYYCIANNVAYALSKFGYIMEYSMYHTIAGKTNSTVSKVIDKYKVGNDIIVPYQDAKGKLRYRKFYNEGFKRKPPMYYTEVNDLSYTIAIPQPTLTERLDARTCELCGKVGPVVMRHVRKLNQLKGKTECDRLMLEKHRKTLVVCEKCYAKIHSHAK